MNKTSSRYVEVRRDGTDTVGSLSARRIPKELRCWLEEEADRTKRTQRAIMEDVLEAFIRHRNRMSDRYPYENLPRHEGKIFRMYIRLDLLNEFFDVVERDRVFNGDVVTAAIRFELSKDGATDVR